MRWAPAVAWTCAALAAVSIAAALALRTVVDEPQPALELLGSALIALPALIAGIAIARRRPTSAIGPLVALLGLYPAADLAFGAWADAGAEGAAPGAGWAQLLFENDWLLVFGAISLLLLLFPDGRPAGPRWRWAVALAVTAPALGLIASAVRDRPFDAPHAAVARPIPTAPDALAATLLGIAFAALLAGLALAATSAILRLRRSRGAERVQMKWLAAAGVLLPVAFVVGVVEGALTEGTGPATVVLFLAVYLAVVAAVAVAMLRHGLYDVDRVISRTIAWVLISGLLAGGFAVVALLVAVPLGGGSALATGIAVLVVALAFDPLRRHLQSAVDRRFDRDRSRAVELVDAFASRLRDGQAEPEEVEDVLRRALGDPGLRLLVWLPEPRIHADVLGVPTAAPEAGGGRAVTRIDRGDSPVGLIVHADRLLERQALVSAVVRAAALPVEVARLHCELRGRLQEVEQSRARIVRAGYDERRRLERDLHDGAQQRLVSLGMALRRVQRRIREDADALRALDGAVDEVAETVRDLREIARGLRPGALDRGLGPALAELARRAPVAVEVARVEPGLPPEIEEAAYYVVCEAIANVVKHAEATHVLVRAERLNGSLVVSVADDGRGGADPDAGGGLAGRTDRVAAHGGVLSLDSRPGEGTRLKVELPCGS